MIFNNRKPTRSNYAVLEQPANIKNVFTIVSGEQILQTYECDRKVCGCGPIYTVTLTDARIIQRYQDYCCCCRADHVDQMLFLSDISSIKDRVANRCLSWCSCDCLLCLFFLCCCLFQCCCSKDSAIPISLNGAFGSEVFIFSRRNVERALAEIPAAAMPHKTFSSPQNYRF
jgi:hypothetical protein